MTKKISTNVIAINIEPDAHVRQENPIPSQIMKVADASEDPGVTERVSCYNM